MIIVNKEGTKKHFVNLREPKRRWKLEREKMVSKAD